MFLLDHLLFLHGGVRFADRRKEKKGKVRYVGDLGELNENISIIICRGTDDNFFSSYFFLLIKNEFSTDDDFAFFPFGATNHVVLFIISFIIICQGDT